MVKLFLVICHLGTSECGTFTTRQAEYQTWEACQVALAEAVYKMNDGPLHVKRAWCERHGKPA